MGSFPDVKVHCQGVFMNKNIRAVLVYNSGLEICILSHVFNTLLTIAGN